MQKDALGIVVTGANGRMGKNIIKLVMEDKDLSLMGATEHPNSPAIGADAGLNAGTQPTSVMIASDLETFFKQAQGVIIDFTLPASTLKNLEFALTHNVPIVIGTTAFNEEQKKLIQKSGEKIPVIFASNMSVGMNLLFKLVDQAAKVLQDNYDIEIFEAHHNKKMDAPSGSAMKLAGIVCDATDRNVHQDLVYARQGIPGARKKKEIGMQVLRGGDIVGEHTVFFCGEGERLELKHVATERTTFASGAILAAKWLAKQRPGLYDMQDVLSLR